MVLRTNLTNWELESTYGSVHCTREGNCRARLHTTESSKNPDILKFVGTHNHEPDPIQCERREAINAITESAKTTQLPPSQIIAAHTASLSKACKGKLPLKYNMARVIRKVRSRDGGSLVVPHRKEDIQLPDEFTMYQKQNFLFYDSGATQDRLMIFTTEQNLNFLEKCDVWMMDGTFKSSPTLFDQLFIVHGYRNKTTFPLVYCLMPNWTTPTYLTLFQQLKNGNPNLDPKMIMTDFERASRNAFHQVFPAAEGKGCFFHFRQCFYRHIQRTREVYDGYSNDSEFKLMLNHLVALAFVPPEDVETCYERLMEEPFFVNNAEILVEFIQYFERTWIGTVFRHRKVPALFSIGLWNCFHSILEELPKTNNFCEGFHSGFSGTLGAAHPTIYKLIDAFKSEQGNTTVRMEQLIAGKVLAPPDRRYEELNKKLRTIVEQYGADLSDIEYLRRIAYCIC